VSFDMQLINKQIHWHTYVHFENEEPRLFMDKMLVFVLNKYDLINDEEIASMYQDELNKHVIAYFKKTFKYTLDAQTITHNTFVVS
jgi:GTPase SAR1 family protein